MKMSIRKASTLVAVIVLALAVSACRSRSTQRPTTTPAEPVIEAPYVPPVEPAVRVPDDDFVTDRNVREEGLPSDLADLNRVLRERGMIRDAFYAFDAATLDSEAREALAMSASWLRQNPGYRLIIEGHTDERGTSQYNLALGERRAYSAQEYLATLGVENSRMSTVSYGEERPFETGGSEAAHAQNRRAHLVVTR